MRQWVSSRMQKTFSGRCTTLRTSIKPSRSSVTHPTFLAKGAICFGQETYHAVAMQGPRVGNVLVELLLTHTTLAMKLCCPHLCFHNLYGGLKKDSQPPAPYRFMVARMFMDEGHRLLEKDEAEDAKGFYSFSLELYSNSTEAKNGMASAELRVVALSGLCAPARRQLRAAAVEGKHHACIAVKLICGMTVSLHEVLLRAPV